MPEEQVIEITFLPGVNYLIFKKDARDRFFISNNRTLGISVLALSHLISFLVKKEFLSPKVLEGILEEYYSD